MSKKFKKSRKSTGNSPIIFTTVAVKRWHRLKIFDILEKLNKRGNNTHANSIVGAAIEMFSQQSLQEQERLLAIEHAKDFKNSNELKKVLSKKGLW